MAQAGFLVEPFDSADPEKAERFLRKLLSAADEKEVNQWTAGDVMRGDDEGGINNPLAANMAVANRTAKTRAHNVRMKQARQRSS